MIQILKLITGEELIGDLTEKDSQFIVKEPCAIQVMVSRADNTPTMSLVPYAFYADEHAITIDKAHVIWNAKPMDELYNQYNRVFGSGIQLAGV